MFQDRLFALKYFLGWYPSSLAFSLVIKNPRQGLLDVLALAFMGCVTGLFFLGLTYGAAKIKDKTPVQWEIVWWCYPPISVLVFFWSIFRAFARF